MRRIEDLVRQMTLEEKAGMCSGSDFWHLKGVERLGIPSVMVADGPHGLRRQDEAADHLGINDSICAVCFPSAAGLAASFAEPALKTQLTRLAATRRLHPPLLSLLYEADKMLHFSRLPSQSRG